MNTISTSAKVHYSDFSNIRFRLRSETFHAHEELERTFDEMQFFTSLSGYKKWLKIMLKMHSKFAPLYDRGCYLTGLAPISDELLLCLKSDLGPSKVDYTLPSERVDDPESIGVVYVVEGSSLGAKILRKRLDKSPKFSQNYLTRLTKDSRERWGHLTDELEDNPSFSEMKFEDIREGALDVFRAMKRDLDAELELALG